MDSKKRSSCFKAARRVGEIQEQIKELYNELDTLTSSIAGLMLTDQSEELENQRTGEVVTLVDNYAENNVFFHTTAARRYEIKYDSGAD